MTWPDLLNLKPGVIIERVFDRMPIKIKIWLWIAKYLPFLTASKRYYILCKKCIPWVLNEFLAEFYDMERNVEKHASSELPQILSGLSALDFIIFFLRELERPPQDLLAGLYDLERV